jgi:hypothetical protein
MSSSNATAAPTAASTADAATFTPTTTYTAPFLAHLSTLILTRPRPILNALFHSPHPTPLPLLTPPESTTSVTARCITTFLLQPGLNASPDTIPYALALLLRFRQTPRPADLVWADDAQLMLGAVIIAHMMLSDWEVGWEREMSAISGMRVSRIMVRGLIRGLVEALEYRTHVGEREWRRIEGRAGGMWEGRRR